MTDQTDSLHSLSVEDDGSGEFLIKPEFKPKPIRSFVIRAGRITAGQKSAFEHWWPHYGLSLHKGPLDIPAIFGRTAPLVVEIGFGMGDSLLEMARQDPDTDFIGIEVHPPGVGRIINVAGVEKLTNLRIFMADAMDVLDDCIPAGSVDACSCIFPIHGTRKDTTSAALCVCLLSPVFGNVCATVACFTWLPIGKTMRSICSRS